MSKTSLSQIASVLADRTMNTDNNSTLAKEIALYLISEKRVNDLESILREVKIIRQDNGILDVKVDSAHDLSESDIDEIKSLIKREFTNVDSIVIDQSVDTNLVGGVKLQTASNQLDMTIKNKIDTFKRLTSRGNI